VEKRIVKAVRDYHPMDSAYMWYFIAHARRFKKYSRPQIQALANECSAISEAVPIHYANTFKPGELLRLVDTLKLKLISADYNNRFTIKGIDKKFLPSQIYVLMVYCLDRLTKGGLDDKPEYSWVKMAKMVMKRDAKIKPTRKKQNK